MAEYVDLTVEQDGDSDLVKDLRKQIKNAHKQRDDERKRADDAAKVATKLTLRDTFKAKGLDPDEIADYVPADVTDETTLNEWLEGKGKIFAKLAKTTAPAAQDPAPDPTGDGDESGILDLAGVDLDDLSGADALTALFAQVRKAEEGGQAQRAVGPQKTLQNMAELAAKAKDLPPEDFYASLHALK